MIPLPGLSGQARAARRRECGALLPGFWRLVDGRGFGLVRAAEEGFELCRGFWVNRAANLAFNVQGWRRFPAAVPVEPSPNLRLQQTLGSRFKCEGFLTRETTVQPITLN